MTSLPSYGKIWNLGHRQLSGLFDGPVVVQEKVDGSYFSFGMIEGHLQARSKGQSLDFDAPDKMFSRAIDIVKQLGPHLEPNFVYCGEYLRTPKHNTLAYDRTPANHVILFDIEKAPRTESWLTEYELKAEADRIGLEVVPSFKREEWSHQSLTECLETISVLGGQKLEGVVIKNYAKFGIDGKVLRGKHVSEAYKEVHGADWKARHPSGRDIKLDLALAFRTPARWNKAIQHLRERGELTDSPKDIGPLLREVNLDTLTECSDDIKERLFRWAWKDLSREITKGFPEFYKDLLMRRQFDDGA